MGPGAPSGEEPDAAAAGGAQAIPEAEAARPAGKGEAQGKTEGKEAGREGGKQAGKEVAAAAPGGAEGEGGEGAAGPAAGAVKLHMPEPPTAPSPATQKRIAGVKRRAGGAAAAKSALPPGKDQVGDARGAVNEPSAEANAKAAQDLIATVNAAPSPEIVKRCERIREVIRKKRPPDEDALMEAKPEGEALSAGNELNATVQDESKKVQDNYGAMGQTPGGTPAKGQDLPPQPSAAQTPGINAAAATPDAVPPGNVSLDKDVAASKQQMQDAGMEKPAAQLVQSGPVADARNAQGELEQTAKEDPAKVLEGQKQALAKAEEDMAALQAQALASLNASRASTVKGATSKQKGMVGSEESMRTQAAAEANQIFKDAQDQVTTLLKPLASNAMAEWEAAKDLLVSNFKADLAPVQKRVDERHSGAGGFFVGLWDAVTGLPGWAEEAYAKAEKNFGDGVCNKLTEISVKVNSVIAACETIIKSARERIAKIFSDLPESLGAWAAEQQKAFDGKLDALQKQAIDTRDNFNKDLLDRSAQAVDEVRAEIAELRKKAGGLIGRIANAVRKFLDDPVKFIIEGLLELLGIPPASFWAVVAKIKKVIKDIADDPMKFANNLMKGLAMGFGQFFDNIGTHLLKGFLSWLTGGLGDVGVQLPKDLSLKSIITFFLQLMGITWPRIRKVLAKHVGEKNVALLEKVYQLVSFLIEKGPEGIYEMIKEKLDPQSIVDQVIQMAVDYLISAVVKAATARILMLFNPAGAILQALEAIYRVLKWIFQNAARIFTLIETVVNGIADILAGSLGGFANAVEKALAMLIPPVIGFIADYLNFGDLPDTIAKKIKSFQDWIMGLIEKALVWLIEKGKALLAAVGIGGKDKDKEKKDGKFDGQIGKTVNFTAGKEHHRLWIEATGANAVVMMASGTGKEVAKELEDYRTKAATLPGDKGAEVLSWIGQAEALLGQTDATADQLAAKAKAPEPEPGEITSLDDEVESDEANLASLIARIREALGIELKDRFAAQFDKMHPLARDYSLSKLEGGGDTTKGATSWDIVRNWLLQHGLIFTQPLTRTTTYVAEVVQPQAHDAAVGGIEQAAEQNGFKTEDIEKEKGKSIQKLGETVVDRSRSDVNAGSVPFALSKQILQEFAFSEQVRPYLTLRSAYAESSALANEIGLGERQLHHLVTEKMVSQLKASQPQLNPQAMRDNPRYQYMSSPGGHIGYETWHRHYDATMYAFIATFPPAQMREDDLVQAMHNYYQSDHGYNVTKRIPGVNLL